MLDKEKFILWLRNVNNHYITEAINVPSEKEANICARYAAMIECIIVRIEEGDFDVKEPKNA